MQRAVILAVAVTVITIIGFFNQLPQTSAITSPTLTVNPTSGPPGIQVILAGSGYDPNVQVEIDFIETSSIIVSNVFTDGTGQFAIPVVIPAGAIAPFLASFSAHEIANPSITASIPFSVILQTIPSSVSLTASPTPAVVGTPETLFASINDPSCPSCTSFSYSWTMISRPIGSSAALSNPIAPSPSFTPDLPGTYQVSLVVTDQLGLISQPGFITISASSCGTCVPTVSPTASPNPAPVGTLVTLDANPSDAGCSACIPLFTYQWSLTSRPIGSSALLSSPTLQNPTFTPDVTGNYQARVVATDSQGLISQPAFITISASSCGTCVPTVSPTASPNPAPVGTMVTLDANPSDAGCTACVSSFAYHWSISSRPAGSSAFLSSPSVQNTAFTPDLPGAYQFSLIATDLVGHSSAPAFVTVTAVTPISRVTISNTSPTLGNPIQLSATTECGSSSCGTSETFSYQWRLTSMPPGSSATLSSSNVATPTFTPNVLGDYSVSLAITDALGNSATASKSITVVPSPIPPTIIAPNTITVGKSYTASVTARPGMTYAWGITGGTITGATTGGLITFTGTSLGTLTLSATETNAAGDGATGSISIAVVTPPAGCDGNSNGNNNDKCTQNNDNDDNGKRGVVKVEIIKYPIIVGASGITTDSSWFHEVEGLNQNIDITEYKEGGKNNGTPKHLGPAVFTKITLIGEYSATTSIPDNYVKNLFKGVTLKNAKNNNPTKVSSNVLNIGLECNSFSAGGVTFQRVTDQNRLPNNFVITKFVWSNALINTDNGKNALSDWISDVKQGKNIHKNITVTLLSSDPNTVVLDYHFGKCFPSKYSGPPFDSKASDSGLESITLHHVGATRTK